MTAPLFFLPAGELSFAAAGTLVRLTGPEGHHAATVRRIRTGEAVLLADGSGRRAEAVVASVEPPSVSLRVVEVTEVPAAQPRFVLVQALAKGGRDEQAVEAATELGVDEVLPWQAARSVVVWRAERAERGRRKWAAVARAAAKQSRRLRVPSVGEPLGSGALAARLGDAALALVLHEEASEPLAGLVAAGLPTTGDVVVVVGPEGGIAPDELEVLEAAGARSVRLGTEVLRSSTAGPAALSVLSAASRWR